MLGHIWVRTDYRDIPKRLIYKLKFKSARGAAKIIANLMYEVIPFFDANTLIVHIPTVNGRRRQRGFDHAELVARELSKISGLPHKKLLGRIGSARQVGSSRQERLKQLTDAFYVRDSVSPDTRVLLVDDIVTTGGTLEAAASMLKDSGIKKIDAVVLAQK